MLEPQRIPCLLPVYTTVAVDIEIPKHFAQKKPTNPETEILKEISLTKTMHQLLTTLNTITNKSITMWNNASPLKLL